MSFQITEAFVQQYKGNMIKRYQQKPALLKGTIREESLTGDAHFFERLGATAAVLRTSRHGDSPQIDSPHSRRMVTLGDYEWGDLVDQQDKIRLLISPESEYAINGAYAMNRTYDDVVIASFGADAKAGQKGETNVTFASEAAADLDFSGGALTLQQLTQLKRKLDDKDVEGEGRYVIMDPAGFEQLLKQTTTPNVSSADYNNIKALVNGEVNTMLGFTFLRSTRLPVPAANQRYCFAWHRDAMGAAIGKDITTRIAERSDKSFAAYVYLCQTLGATRIQGDGVVRFKISTTA